MKYYRKLRQNISRSIYIRGAICPQNVGMHCLILYLERHLVLSEILFISQFIMNQVKVKVTVVSDSLQPMDYTQSMEFFMPGYWSGLPFPSPEDLPNPGIEPRSPTLQADAVSAEPQGKPFRSYQFSSVAQSFLTLCNPMDCSI